MEKGFKWDGNDQISVLLSDSPEFRDRTDGVIKVLKHLRGDDIVKCMIWKWQMDEISRCKMIIRMLLPRIRQVFVVHINCDDLPQDAAIMKMPEHVGFTTARVDTPFFRRANRYQRCADFIDEV